MEVFILHWQPKFPLVHDVCFMAGAKYFLPLFRYATPGKCVFSASCTLIDLHGFNNSLTRFHPVLRGFGVSLCSVLQYEQCHALGSKDAFLQIFQVLLVHLLALIARHKKN